MRGIGLAGQSGSATRPPSTAALGSIAHVTETTAPDVSLRVLVYSSQAATRGRVISALGTRTHPDLPRLGEGGVVREPLGLVLSHGGTSGPP